MNDALGPERQDSARLDLEQLARDWITICRSELAALTTDPEAQETWRTLLALWAGAAESMLAAIPRRARDRADGRAGAATAARPAAAAAAPDAGDAEIEQLAGRLAELERRLDELERMGRGSGRPRRKAAKRGG
jgi:hypothetical protein